MDRYGYWNKILHVNLSDRSTWIEEPGDLFFRRYAGGRGLIAHCLLKYVPKGADPLGPDNILVIAPGVLTGAPVPGAGRHSVGAKSPLTGGFGESESGGYWGAELKRAGWDGIVFHGVSPTPVYLWINDGAVVDPEVDRGGGDAMEDDPVPAGALQLGAPVAARLRLAEAAGERRFGADTMPPGPGHRRPREHAGRNDENVVRPQRVGALRHVLEETVCDEPPPTGVAPEEEIAGLLDPGAAIREIDVQDLVPVAVAVHGVSYFAPPSIGLKSMTSAPSCSDASRATCSPSTAMVTSASGAMPIIASRSSIVAPPGTV